MSTRIGRQEPTSNLCLPYTETKGEEAISLYEKSGLVAQPWQKNLVYDILAIEDDGLYVHQTFGYEVPRRNGKGEILTIIELFDLMNGRKCLHTAHRTATSSSASVRLASLLKKAGYTEVQRIKKDETYEKAYTYSKQFGLERITLINEGGSVDFRTRTSKGGLGEGFDTLIIDEAQEYTDEQESTLQFLVSDSANPLTVLCGTPPTAVSSGTVFQKMRESCLSGDELFATGWAEWSVDTLSDVNDVDLWYECNPAMGFHLTERKIRAEKKGDEIDYNIQRFGLWLKYNLKSAISREEWESYKCETLPEWLNKKISIGIKFGRDGKNVSFSIALKTKDERTFVETIDCVPIREGDGWIIDNIIRIRPESVLIDGAGRSDILQTELEKGGFKKSRIAKVSEVVEASALFEKMLADGKITHMNQTSLTQSVGNSEHRLIGSSGGFGYKSIQENIDVTLLESVVLANYGLATMKEKKVQRIGY